MISQSSHLAIVNRSNNNFSVENLYYIHLIFNLDTCLVNKNLKVKASLIDNNMA